MRRSVGHHGAGASQRGSFGSGMTSGRFSADDDFGAFGSSFSAGGDGDDNAAGGASYDDHHQDNYDNDDGFPGGAHVRTEEVDHRVAAGSSSPAAMNTKKLISSTQIKLESAVDDVDSSTISMKTEPTEDGTHKISLAKTNRKIKFIEPTAKSFSATALPYGAVFKPDLGGFGEGSTGALGLADIGAANGADLLGVTPSLTAASASTSTLDPRKWLLRKRVSVGSPTTTTDAIVVKDEEGGVATTPDKGADTTTTSPAVEESRGHNLAEEEYVNMFWLDACENNGVIYLFGKVPLTNDAPAPASASTGAGKPALSAPDKKFTTTNNSTTTYVSCCVAVYGAERNLFVLPRTTGGFKADGSPVRAGMAEVYQELNRLLVPDIIPRAQGQTFRCKSVKRNYAFEHGDVPRYETDYLKVVYSAKHSVPTVQQCSGGKHIERIFGSTSSALELFLLKRKLMGPCWITIKNPRTITEPISWCKLEIGE